MGQLNNVCENTVQVYEMFTGRERTEIKLMAVIVGLYYAPYMLKAKDTARSVVNINWIFNLSHFLQQRSSLGALSNLTTPQLERGSINHMYNTYENCEMFFR